MAEVLAPLLNRIRIPSTHDRVYKDECAFCFDSPVCKIYCDGYNADVRAMHAERQRKIEVKRGLNPMVMFRANHNPNP